MSDKDMEAVLREWTQEAPPGQPDPSRVVGSIVGRLGSTRRRRRRRWLARWFGRKPDEPEAIDRTVYRPSPVQASTGQDPTVIRRTTSMFSPAKAITAGAIVFALGGAFLIAQPFDRQGSVPGADGATTEPSAAAIVTGWLRPRGDMTQEPTEVEADGILQSRGSVREDDELEMDDPRLTGTVSTLWNTDLRTVGDAGAALVAITKRIENEEGSWSGSCTSLAYVPPTEDPYVESCLMTGAGAYDGLSAYLVQVTTDTPYSPVGGLIFAGDPPPMPELPSAE